MNNQPYRWPPAVVVERWNSRAVTQEPVMHSDAASSTSHGL
jgi:hypothetical protein